MSAFDHEGFLVNLKDWTPDLATEIAKNESVELTAAHWEIIYLVRNFYSEYDTSPSMRALVKKTQIELGNEKGKSTYLLSLFPSSPAKQACKIAGLPKPANCL